MKGFLKVMKRSTLVIFFSMGAFFFCTGMTKADAATYTKKEIPVYDNKQTDPTSINCLFSEDMPNVPLVPVDDWLEILFNGREYSVEKTSRGYRIDPVVSGEDHKGFFVDPDADTIVFDPDSELVVGTNTEEFDGSYKYLVSVERNDEFQTIYPLSRYGIDLIARDGKVYSPLSTISDITAVSYAYTEFVDGKIYLARMREDDTFPEFFADLDAEFFKKGEREADEADYVYRELCFATDCLWGHGGSTHSQEFVDRIKKDGLDHTLEAGGMIEIVDLAKVKKYLTSTNLAEYAAGIILLNYLMKDAGHTELAYGYVAAYYGDSDSKKTKYQVELLELLRQDEALAKALSSLYKEYKDESEITDSFFKYREKEMKEPVKEWKTAQGNYVASLYISETTAIFRFDDFISNVVRLESGEKPILEALEYARKKKCENFVVDLTTNYGGLTSVWMYMMNIITGKEVPSILQDVHSGAIVHVLYAADRNLDGKLDEEDKKVFYDFRYAIMCTRITGSSANIMSSVAKDVGIPLLGEKTRGASGPLFFMGIPVKGGNYCLASDFYWVNAAYEDIDGGVEPTYQLVKKTESGIPDSSALFDPYTITKTVNAYYGIGQKSNPMKLKVVKKSIKAKKVAKKKVSVKKALVVTGAKGSVTIKKTGGSKRLTITKSGVVTVKKGTKKGSYKIRVKVSTGGTGVYKKATKTVTVKVKVV